ncbi:MAG TPA: hypothetical protein PKC87_05225 [Candidatus Absconditabacterales bacterium]|nr:hypothetical protein [Candidatus Absconditabacterales bacterium]
MRVHELKSIILAAVAVKEKSDDATFAEMLQREIETLLVKVINVMGKSIDDLKDDKKVPQDIEETANKLTECYSV